MQQNRAGGTQRLCAARFWSKERVREGNSRGVVGFFGEQVREQGAAAG